MNIRLRCLCTCLVTAVGPVLLANGCSSSDGSADPAPSSPVYTSDAGPGGRMEVPSLPPEVGMACLPGSEQSASFSGASLYEVAVDTDRRCSETCLSYHFQGRVSCPYGQNENQIEMLPADDAARCRLPDASGAITEQPVEVPVGPQLVGRTAEQAVYCSCRCDGPDPNRSYCVCPDGMECLELFPATGDPALDIYAGSYCVKRDSPYDPDANYGSPCIHGDPAALEPCGDGNP